MDGQVDNWWEEGKNAAVRIFCSEGPLLNTRLSLANETGLAVVHTITDN